MDIKYQCVYVSVCLSVSLSLNSDNSFFLKGRDQWRRSVLIKVSFKRNACHVINKIKRKCQVIHKIVIKFFLRKGLPGCAHFIRPKVYIG